MRGFNKPNQSVERMRLSHRLRPTVPGSRPVILLPTVSGLRRRIAHLFRSANGDGFPINNYD